MRGAPFDILAEMEAILSTSSHAARAAIDDQQVVLLEGECRSRGDLDECQVLDRVARGPVFQRFLEDRCEQTSDGDINTARMPWPDEWFTPSNRMDMTACRRLWGAALRENVRCIWTDAIKPRGGAHSYTYVGGATLGWVGSQDFYILCEMVGFDRDYAASLANQITLIAHDPERARIALSALVAKRSTDSEAAE